MTLRLLLEPLDVWLFRDGRPFTAGSDVVARSRFPPTPYTIYGMLRSLIVFQAAARGSVRDLAYGDEVQAIAAAVGDPDDFSRLRLRGPLLAAQRAGTVARYFPVPRDVVRFGAGEPGSAEQTTIIGPAGESPAGTVTASGLRLLWARHPETPKAAVGWLAEPEFWHYLAGEAPRLEGSESLYQSEERPGVGIDHATGTAADRLLYLVQYIRPRDGVGLAVDVLEGLEAAPSLIAFGGEARGARCTTLPVPPEQPPATLAERVARSGRVKLVLATPAIFDQGWLPSWVDKGTLETGSGQPRLRLVSAAVPRAEAIGGFDVVRRAPRPIERAVPAGSVYFFEEREPGAALDALNRWFGQCLSDRHPAIGFGLSYVGGWDYV